MGEERISQDAVKISHIWLSQFSTAVSSGDVKATTTLFLSNGWLRDILVFTWNHRSLCGHHAISEYLTNHLEDAKIRNVELDEDHSIMPTYAPEQELIEAAFKFETPIAIGRGHVRLLQDYSGAWKALTVFTTLDDLKGHEERSFESGYYEGHTRTWSEVYEEEKARIETDPHVIIIGAGQSGLNVGARFRQMNILTLLIDRSDAVGDVWRKRYPTLTLHTPNPHHTMLYTRFSSTAPKYTSRDKVAAMLEQYAYNQDLVIWNRTTMLPTPSYDNVSKRWTVSILRDGVEVTLHPYHIVLAMGTLGKPHIPDLPGKKEYKGVSLHATDFKGARTYAGKKTIVVGASQTGADISQDLVTCKAASVTLVQRSSTIVVSANYTNSLMDPLWPMNSDPSIGDFRAAAMPIFLLKQFQIADKKRRIELQKDMLEGLTKAGLKIHEGEEGAGQLLRVHERLNGYWLDVGTADLVIKGLVQIKSGTEPDHFTHDGLAFKDGSTLEADLVVFATGYEPITDAMQGIFGERVAAQTSPAYGLDAEGEPVRAYRPSGHPGLWWAVGDFMYSRYYSKSLALQIKGRELGLVKN
ncbi:dimethylaniline monooxygenase [Ramaria rubella]|nr:dimethylaniline monooxygenase [Ramaria rubella]